MEAAQTGERALSVGAYPLLVIFHLFPLHAPITLWFMDAPFGKFSWNSVLNLPAGIAWAVMECVSVGLLSLSFACTSVADLAACSLLRNTETTRTLRLAIVAHLDFDRLLFGALFPPCAVITTVPRTEACATAPRRRPRRIHLQRAQRLALGVPVRAAPAENRAAVLGGHWIMGARVLREW